MREPLRFRWVAWVAAGFTCIAAAAQQEVAEPYHVAVWSRVLFDADGKASEIAVVDPAAYPPQFLANVKERLAKANIKPPEVEGRAATLKTGVLVQFLVTPSEAGALVKLQRVTMSPLPVKTPMAAFPKGAMRGDGVTAEAVGVCVVGVDGRCRTVEIEAPAGVTEPIRRYLRLSLAGWEFEPQQIDGNAVEGEYRLDMRFHNRRLRPVDFRQDKLQRITHSR